MSTEPYLKQDSNPTPLTFQMPAGAIDAHMHVIGPFDRFPLSPKTKYAPFYTLTCQMRAGAIDAHMHVIGPFDRFPLSPKSKYAPFEATWQEQKEILLGKLGFW